MEEALASQARLTDWVGAETPVPESDNIVGELTASLMNETLPVTAPAAEGLKVMFAVAVPPGAMVTGKVSPLRLKPAPDTLALETEMAVPPELLSVTPELPLLPTVTSPKSTPEGLRLS